MPMESFLMVPPLSGALGAPYEAARSRVLLGTALEGSYLRAVPGPPPTLAHQTYPFPGWDGQLTLDNRTAQTAHARLILGAQSVLIVRDHGKLRLVVGAAVRKGQADGVARLQRGETRCPR